MRIICLLLLSACTLTANAAPRIFACVPEWGSLARELAGPEARIDIATTAQQDPHHVQARPSLLARARRADLLVCNGADLEVGWLPLLLRRAGNPRIQPGQPGHFLAAEQVTLLDVPEQLDRSHGDVHPQGNPHLHLDPARVRQVAVALGHRLAIIDAEHRETYQSNTARFLQRWDEATQIWRKRADSLKDLSVVVVHSEWRYLFDWTGLREAARLEPRPGIPPSAAHLAEVLQTLQSAKADAILTTPGRSTRGPDWLRERTDLPVLLLPYTVGGSPQATDLYALFDDTLARLLTLTK